MFLVSCLFDAAAAAWMIGLFTALKKQPDWKKGENRYFQYLPLSVIALAIIGGLASIAWMYEEGVTAGSFHQQFLAEPGTALTVLLICIADVYFTTVFLYYWIYFLAWRLYHDRGYRKRRFWRDMLPLLVAGAVMVASFVLLTLSDRSVVFFTVALIVFYIVRLYYFAVSLWLLHEYRSQNGHLRFFSVWAFFLPVFVGWALQDLTSLSLCAFGSALGVYLLYRSMVAERLFMDRETGLYNTRYIEYLRGLVGKGEFTPRGAMVFAGGEGAALEKLSEALKKALPEDCEPIRCADDRVVVLAGVGERGPLLMVLEDVRDAVGVEGAWVLIKKGEAPAAFMDRVLQDRMDGISQEKGS